MMFALTFETAFKNTMKLSLNLKVFVSKAKMYDLAREVCNFGLYAEV